jgi:hypothetical protein
VFFPSLWGRARLSRTVRFQKASVMETSFPKTFFVSYSRKDAAIVRPVVEMMRATGTHVFRDEDSVPPGKRWRDVLAQSIQDADIIIVFWSKNSASSPEVTSEYNQGVTLGKDIIPVLLDDQPLSAVLGEFQCIDFRPMTGMGSRWDTILHHLASTILHTIGIHPVKHITQVVSPLNDIFVAHSVHCAKEVAELGKEYQTLGLTMQQWTIPQDSPVPYEKQHQAGSCGGLLTPLVSSSTLKIVSNA